LQKGQAIIEERGNSGGVTAWDKLESFTAYTKKRGGKTGRNATPTQDFG